MLNAASPYSASFNTVKTDLSMQIRHLRKQAAKAFYRENQDIEHIYRRDIW